MSRFSVAMARWMLVPSVLFSMFTMALPSWSFADDELAELTRLVDKLAVDQTREEALEALSAKVDAAKDAGASEVLQARLIDAWNNSKDPDNQQVKDGIKQVSRLIEGRIAVQRLVEKFTDDDIRVRQAAEDELLDKGLGALRRGEYKNFARTITNAKKALVERLGKEEVPWEHSSIPEVKSRVAAVRGRLREMLVNREDFQELKLGLESTLDQLDDAVATPFLRTTHAHTFDTYDKIVEDIKKALERGNTEEARTLISKDLPKAIDDTPFGKDKKNDMRDAVPGLIEWLESLEETDTIKGLKQMGMVLPVPAEKAFVSGDMPSGRIVVKGHVRTAEGRALAGTTLTLQAPKPTPRDFVTGTDPGWDPKKAARPPLVETSGPGGSFTVTLQGVPGMVPVSDVPVKDMIVTLDTRERYIVHLQPGIKPTDFVNDHGLQDVKIISVPSEAGGGPLVTYPVPSDEKKAKELQDAISKDDRVAFAESDDCREIQPDGIEDIKKRLSQLEAEKVDLEKAIKQLEKAIKAAEDNFKKTVDELKEPKAKKEQIIKDNLPRLASDQRAKLKESTARQNKLEEEISSQKRLLEGLREARWIVVARDCDETPAPPPQLKEKPKEPIPSELIELKLGGLRVSPPPEEAGPGEEEKQTREPVKDQPKELISTEIDEVVQKVKEEYERLLTYTKSVMKELAVDEDQLNDLITDAATLTKAKFEIAREALFKLLAWQAAFRALWEEAQRALILKHSSEETHNKLRKTTSGVRRLQGELTDLLKEHEEATKEFERGHKALLEKTLAIMKQWDDFILGQGGDVLKDVQDKVADTGKMVGPLVGLAAFLAKWRNWETYLEESEKLVGELQAWIPELKAKMEELAAAQALEAERYNDALNRQNLLPKLAKEGLPQYRPEERFGKLLEEDKDKAPMSVNEFIDKMNSLNRAGMAQGYHRVERQQ